MGWLFSNWTRTELIRRLTQSEETENARYDTLTYTLRGNVLWSLVKITAKQPDVVKLAAGESMIYIGCTLLECHHGEWGYKSMDESVHPYYYSCPLSYLERAPEQSPEWRERVRAHHAKRRAIRAKCSMTSTAAFA